jgi:hypothetical protein
MSESTSKPRRRWFQFSIGTMLLLVTVFAVWLGWELKVVRDRQAMRRWIEEREGGKLYDVSGHGTILRSLTLYVAKEYKKGPRPDDSPELPWARRLLGDEVVSTVYLPFDATPEERANVAHAFAESSIYEWERCPPPKGW